MIARQVRPNAGLRVSAYDADPACGFINIERRHLDRQGGRIFKLAEKLRADVTSLMDWPEAAVKGELIAGGVNAVLIIALVATRRRWKWDGEMRRVSAVAEAGPAKAKAPRRLRLQALNWWAVLMFILLMAGAMRWRFAHSSLWWDEVWNVRNATVGKFLPDKKRPDEFRFVKSSWAQALWNYRKPTNHPPFTLLSKACHETWASFTKAPRGRFDEFVIRFPNFVVSLATVGLLGWLLRAWGFPLAGLMAALLLAMHPWHIRYGIDGRAYGLLTFATVTGLWCLWKMLGTDGPRRSVWWWLFGLNQALIAWCHLLSVWICAAFAAAAAIVIWREFPRSVRGPALLRLLAVNVLGAMLFLQLFLPNLLQAITWGERNQDGNVLDWNYFLATLSQLCFGVDAADILNKRRIDVGWFVAIACGLVAVMAFGYWRLWKLQRVPVVLLGCFIASAGLFLGVVALTEMYFYHRFVIPCVVPFCLLLPMAPHFLPHCQLRPRLLAISTGLTIFVCLGLQGVWKDQQHLLSVRPYAPLREVTEYLQQQPPGRVIGYGFGSEALNGYWERVEVHKESPLRPTLEEALAGRTPLYVAYGYEQLNRKALPDGFELLDDPARFFVARNFYGIDPQFTFRVLKAKRP